MATSPACRQSYRRFRRTAAHSPGWPAALCRIVDPSGGNACGGGRRHAVGAARAWCRCVKSHAVFEQWEFAAESLLDRASSMSSGSPARPGARAAELERDFSALIRKITPDGRLTEVIEVIESGALIGWHPGEETLP